MNEFSSHLKSLLRFSLLLLCAALLAWVLLPAHRSFFSGMLLGIVAGILNAAHLAWRIHSLADSVITQQRSRRGLGFFTRAALALLLVFIAMKLHYSALAAIIGLFLVQVATLVLGLKAKLQK
jgi:ATP synthase protein I